MKNVERAMTMRTKMKGRMMSVMMMMMMTTEEENPLQMILEYVERMMGLGMELGMVMLMIFLVDFQFLHADL